MADRYLLRILFGLGLVVVLTMVLLTRSTLAQQPGTLYAWNNIDENITFNVDGQYMCSPAPLTICSRPRAAGSH